MDPVLRLRPDGDLRFLIICDHASNHVPPHLDNLGLPAAELNRHIAYDPGALDVAMKLSEALSCPLVASQFSRLVIDPNRGLDDPTLVMKLSDGAVIPANRDVDPFRDAAAHRQRIEHYYAPYDGAISQAVDAALAADTVPIILSVHSFTPIWRGTPRPWQAAVLWDRDDRLKKVMDAHMANLPEIVFGDNEPYSGRLKNDCLYRHGTMKGLPHALFELRQDEVADAAGQALWAARLAAMLSQAAATPGMAEIRHFGSVHQG